MVFTWNYIFFLYDIYSISNTNKTTCISANEIFNTYIFRFIFPVLLGFLPLIIRITFGVLAFINVPCLQNRQVPIVRLERDQQLTAMVWQ